MRASIPPSQPDARRPNEKREKKSKEAEQGTARKTAQRSSNSTTIEESEARTRTALQLLLLHGMEIAHRDNKHVKHVQFDPLFLKEDEERKEEKKVVRVVFSFFGCFPQESGGCKIAQCVQTLTAVSSICLRFHRSS